MTDFIDVSLTGLMAVSIMMTAGWGFSVIRRNVTIIVFAALMLTIASR